ncbi:MAG: YqaA family protein [Rikenellaceae bacterium]
MEWLIEWGYWGLFIGAFIAATILPFSSDVMLVALLAAGGEPIIAISSATLGNWLGGLTSYYVGYLGRWEWIERYLGVKRSKLEAQSSRIKQYGALLALMTWLPIVGDVMAVALGFYRVNPKTTAIYMLIGKGLRFILWAVLYYWGETMFG